MKALLEQYPIYTAWMGDWRPQPECSTGPFAVGIGPEEEEDDYWEPNGLLIDDAKSGDRESARKLLEIFAEEAKRGTVSPDLLAYMGQVAERILEADWPGNKRLGDDMHKATWLAGRREQSEQAEIERRLHYWMCFRGKVTESTRERNKLALESCCKDLINREQLYPCEPKEVREQRIKDETNWCRRVIKEFLQDYPTD